MAARQVPADFAEALRAHGGALQAFESLPPEAKAQWVRYVEGARTRGGRARRIDEAVRRIGAHRAGAATEETVVERPPPPPPREWWPWLALLLLLLVAALLAWFFLSRDNGNKVHVPAVTRMSLAQARVRLHDRHLVDSVTRVPSKLPRGTVVAQRPRAGRKVDKGSIVHLNVSNAPALAAVPNVVGQDADTAERQLVALKLVPNEIGAFSTKPRGTVIALKPGAGTRVRAGSTVDVTVSHGRGKVAVPAVVGQTVQQATKALRNADLVPKTVQVPSDQPAGTVVAQDPKPAAKVLRGTPVRINVSKGGSSTTTTTATTTTVATTTTAAPSSGTKVPDVVGQAFAPAVRSLASAGYRPVVTYATSTKPKGTVTAERPAGGTTAARNSRVRITVSAGPSASVLRTVPDVVGDDQQTATSTLQQAGFKVLVLQRRVTDSSQQGTVVDEQPAANLQAPQGGEVAIFVGSTSAP